jgi:lipoprotein-anchoring transpeptidase ErfK/SrfK
MFKLTGLKAISRHAVFGVLAIGAVALSAPATAAPYPPFRLVTPPAPPVQAAPGQNDNSAFELPARFRRQVVSYPTHEAPGTVIIDTPHTYLYYVLGGGQAVRYGIGVGREGFTW